MAKQAVQKPGGAAKKKTPLVKIDPELVEKIGWIVRIRNRARTEVKEWTAADIVEPLIRSSVEREYKVIEDKVENIKKQEADGAKKLKDHDAEEQRK